MAKNNCPNCGAGVEVGASVCGFCNSKFEEVVKANKKINIESLACPFCSFELDRNKKFCNSCGNDITFECIGCNNELFIKSVFCCSCGSDVQNISSSLTERNLDKIYDVAYKLFESNKDTKSAMLCDKIVKIDTGYFKAKLLIAKCLNNKILSISNASTARTLRGQKVVELQSIVKDIIANSNDQNLITEARQLYDPDAKPKATPGGCFIATAVFEDYNHPEVIKLRKFRDVVLTPTYFGRIFIKCYYFAGPTLARILKIKIFNNLFADFIKQNLINFNKKQEQKEK